MPKRVLQFHTNRFAQWRSDNDIDGTSVHATITGDPLGIDIGQDAADILNGEALLPDYAAALDALQEARKRLEKAADDFIGEGMDWNAQQIYDYLKTSALPEER